MILDIIVTKIPFILRRDFLITTSIFLAIIFFCQLVRFVLNAITKHSKKKDEYYFYHEQKTIKKAILFYTFVYITTTILQITNIV